LGRELELDWERLIEATVRSLWDLRRQPTAAARKFADTCGHSVGEQTMRRWFDGARGKPRGPTLDAVLAYAEKLWPDYRERFKVADPPAPRRLKLAEDRTAERAKPQRNDRHPPKSDDEPKRRKARGRGHTK